MDRANRDFSRYKRGMTGRRLTGCAGFLLVMLFLVLSWHLFDIHQLLLRLTTILQHPIWLLLMFTAYWFSFVLKAAAWQAYAGREHPFALYVHGLFYSLFVNHLLPVKAGDLVRTGLLMKKARMRWDDALHSVMVMRLADLIVLGLISASGLLWLGASVSWLAIAVLAALVILAVASLVWLPWQRWPFVHRHVKQLKAVIGSRQGPYILALVAASWILEAAILFGIARLSQIPLSTASSLWVNSMTVGGQIFHVTPGGIGTYENTLSGSLALLGVSWQEAYATALLTHAFKFASAFILGFYSLIRMPVGLREVKEWVRLPGKSPRPTTPLPERTSI